MQQNDLPFETEGGNEFSYFEIFCHVRCQMYDIRDYTFSCVKHRTSYIKKATSNEIAENFIGRLTLFFCFWFFFLRGSRLLSFDRWTLTTILAGFLVRYLAFLHLHIVLSTPCS